MKFFTLQLFFLQISSPNIVLATVKGELCDNDLKKWLKRAEGGKMSDFLMTTPPVKPKGGDVILYKCKSLDDDGYKCDQYTGFQNGGNNTRFASKFTRIYFVLREGRTIIKGFKKEVIFLRKYTTKPDKVILVHYMGKHYNFFTNSALPCTRLERPA